MRKHLFSIYVCVTIAFLFVMGCALTQWFAGTHYEQFELTIDGQKVMVNLPDKLPSLENAVRKGENCFNAKVCAQRFCVSLEPLHDHVDFIYVKTDVIALVWLKTLEMEPEKRFIAWVYFEGKPVSAPINRIRELLKERGPKVDGSVFFKEFGKDLTELQRLILELNSLTAQNL